MKLLSALFFCLLTAQLAQAQVPLGPHTTLTFATVEEGQKILTSRDDFIQRLSPFDRSARLKTDQEISEAEFLKFVSQNVLAWDETEKQRITSALENIQAKVQALNLPFPKSISLIKTTGSEEGGAPYTRAHAIILPKSSLTGPLAKLQQTLCHELFHILSRANPGLKAQLYGVIGFVRCDELAFPIALRTRKLTNPDAPLNDHFILLQHEGKDVWAVPILFSRTEKYDPARGGEFFNYLQLQFLISERPLATPNAKTSFTGPTVKLVELGQLTGFYEQVGRNTQYIIHPEEILASNFVLLVLGSSTAPSPEIIQRMETVLKTKPPQ
ncbi:MAG: hypothetical protein ACO1QS_01420 [Verrucomicrobiota bacterium]